MGLYRSAAGSICVKATSADISGLLSCIGRNGILVQAVDYLDDLSVSFSVSRKNYRKLKELTDRRGDLLEEIKNRGVFWMLRRLCFRPVLLIGMLLVILWSITLPGRIFFIHVEGNAVVPDKRILEAAAESGLSFGVRRRGIRNEKIKNRMLERIPELQWVGVNTDGCNAVITVRERSPEETIQYSAGISSLISSRDGIVISVTAEQGVAVCRIGQAVKQGEVLISGYTDSGLTILGTRAMGDVMAATSRDLKVVTPSRKTVRTDSVHSQQNFSLLVGKKRINFYNGSGIYGGTCVKMYRKYVLELPGGFELPLALIQETVVEAKTREVEISEAAAQELMTRFACDYLAEQMIAGTITDQRLLIEQKDATYQLTGQFFCKEMIGRIREEMIGDYHGKSDGANRECRPGG